MGSPTTSDNRLIFQETDEADNLTATYVYSEQLVDAPTSKRAAPSVGRVDIMVSKFHSNQFRTDI